MQPQISELWGAAEPHVLGKWLYWKHWRWEELTVEKPSVPKRKMKPARTDRKSILEETRMDLIPHAEEEQCKVLCCLRLSTWSFVRKLIVLLIFAMNQ